MTAVFKGAAFTLLLVIALTGAPRQTAERCLAGVTLERDLLHDTGQKLKMQFRGGVYQTTLGEDSCQLSISSEDEILERKPVRVTTIFLARLGGKASLECDRIQTGKGLRFGDSLDRVYATYGQPYARASQNGQLVLNYGNWGDCKSKTGRTRTIRLNSLLIMWSQQASQIQRVVVSSEHFNCEQLDVP